MSYVPLTRPIVIRESITASENPTSGDISLGEIAINSADGNMFIKRTNNSIVQINGGGGASAPNTQIVYGTGTGVDSASTFTYDAATGEFSVQPSANVAPAGINLFAASATSGPTAGANVNIQAGNADGSTNAAAGGNVFITAGALDTAVRSSGVVTIKGGYGGTLGNGGNASLVGGDGGSISGAGGTVFLVGGAPTSGAGGPVNIQAGAGAGGNNLGGNITLAAGQSRGTGTGGSINITAGSSDTTDNANGGDVVITTGSGNGTGIEGSVNINLGTAGTLQISGDAGNAGQVLTSNGPSAAPTWQGAPVSYGTGTFFMYGVQRFGGQDGFGTYRGYGTDGTTPASSNFTPQTTQVNLTYTNSGNGPMLLDEGTWLVTVFAEVAGFGAGACVAGAKLNIEVQNMGWTTDDNLYNIPTGVTSFNTTMTTTVFTAGPSSGERTLILRGYAQWDPTANTANTYDAQVDLKVSVTKIAAAPVYVA